MIALRGISKHRKESPEELSKQIEFLCIEFSLLLRNLPGSLFVDRQSQYLL